MKIAKYSIALGVALISACSLHQTDPTGFIPMNAAPSPGYTKLSDDFGVEVEGGFFTARRIIYFFLDGETQTKELIGVNYFPVYESRQGAYALSNNGSVLLYLHDEGLNEGTLGMETGLYEYTSGVGSKLIDIDARSGIQIAKKLEVDAIVFKRKNCPEEYCTDSKITIRDTDGNEFIFD